MERRSGEDRHLPHLPEVRNSHSIWVDDADVYTTAAGVDADASTSRKRALAERSPYSLKPTGDARTKRIRRSNPEKSVYAIQKEAMCRELNKSTQVRRQLEEQIMGLKYELRNKTEALKTPQLESQYNTLMDKHDELTARLDFAQTALIEKQAQIDQLAAALQHDHQALEDSDRSLKELAEDHRTCAAQLHTAQARCMELDALLGDSHEELRAMHTKLDSLESETEHRDTYVGELRLKVESLVGEREELRLLKEDLVSRIEALSSENSQLIEEKNNLETIHEKLSSDYEHGMESIKRVHEVEINRLEDSLLQAERTSQETLEREINMHNRTKMELVKAEQSAEQLNEKYVSACRDRDMLKDVTTEQNTMASCRINEMDAELSELRPKYKILKETNTRHLSELRSLHENLNHINAQSTSLQEIEASQRLELHRLHEENNLFDSQRTELALGLEREKKWREQVAEQLNHSESLCSKLQRMMDFNATEFEAQTHKMHKRIEELETSFEGSQLQLTLLRCDLEQSRQKENQLPPGVLEKHRHLDQSKISTLESELANQLELLKQERKTTRRLQNQVQELKGNIRIIARVRPMLSNAKTSTPKINVNLTSSDVLLAETEISAQGISRKKSLKVQFDRVFGPEAANAAICEETEYLLQSVLDGRNVCIFAYGQTGSGKTYTMGGEDGVNMYALRKLMEVAKNSASTYQIIAESVEIYNENIYDLLEETSYNTSSQSATTNATTFTQAVLQNRLSIQLNTRTNQPELVGARRVPIDSVETARAVLTKAMRHRSTAATEANERSSRSHFVFTVRVNTATSQGMLHLVDLAGSERLSHSRTEGDRLKETQAINTSLSSLGNVINALLNKRPSTHIPYRSSKLTYLLQGSLSGSAKTMLLTTLSPELSSIEETKSTLRFAEKAARASLK